MDIDNGIRICLNSSNTRDKTRQNHDRLSFKMYYRSVIIHKKRIFPYFQNKVKNLNKYNNNNNNNNNKLCQN